MKPLVIATHANGLVFGLPGNPAAVMVAFRLFVRPALRNAWNWDLGDDSFSGSHRGDSEMYAIIVARKDTDGADWGVSWEEA